MSWLLLEIVRDYGFYVAVVAFVIIWLYSSDLRNYLKQKLSKIFSSLTVQIITRTEVYTSFCALFIILNIFGFGYYGWAVAGFGYYDWATQVRLPGSPLRAAQHIGFLICYIGSGVIFILGTTTRFMELRRAKHKIQVIAWDGWQDDDLYRKGGTRNRKLTKKYLDFLLYLRGLGTVPTLLTKNKLSERYYDVLIADAEYLQTYASAGRLADTEKHSNLNAQWARLPEFIRTEMKDFVRDDIYKTRLAIPCRWGFQEILVREDAANVAGISSGTKYSELKIENILKDTDWHIGIWNWYLPSLAVMLATHEVPLSKVYDQGVAKIKECVDSIVTGPETWRQRMHFTNKIEHIHEKMVSDNVNIFYGAGSWALRPDIDKISILSLVPGLAVFTWTECAAILQETDGSRKRAADLIEHWLSVETQRLLQVGTPTSALPTIEEVLKETYDDSKSKHPARPTLRKLFDEHLMQRAKTEVIPRRLPVGENQIGWEREWTRLRNWWMHGQK